MEIGDRRREAEERKRREREAAARRFRQTSKSNTLFTAGKSLKNGSTVEEKISAINIFIGLKRKSAYPFLRIAMNERSEKVVIASIAAIGKLKIIQAGPELGYLMFSGSVRIKDTILDTIQMIGKKNNYFSILDIALGDDNPIIRRKAESIIKRIYG